MEQTGAGVREAGHQEFLDGARRALRPGGHRLWADFAPAESMPRLDAWAAARFEVAQSRDITAPVLRAMAADGPRRQAIVARHSIPLLRPLLLHFAAADESRETVRRFRDGKAVNFLRQLRVPDPAG